MKAVRIYLPILLALAIVTGIFIGKNLNFSSQPVVFMNEDAKEQKLRQIINFIDYEYVDDVNTDSLLDLTISDLLRKLDPHSTYIAKQDAQRAEENLKGSFEGIGIEYIIYKDTLTILRTIVDGPSEKAGLLDGDRIIEVDGKLVAGEKIPDSDYMKMLKGESGSKVEVKIFRPMDGISKNITIKRGKIPLYSVSVSYMLNDTLGLIKVDRFSETTYVEFHKALKNLKKSGMKSLVLDLRDNPGGLLKTAIGMCDEFLDDDKLIVFTKHRSGEIDYTYAKHKGDFEKGKLVVLINEGSASASEIVAGALQDNDRAIIVGRRSFGKGLVQEEMMLNDGSRIRLTTARYYTPTGRSIQKPYDDGYDAYQEEAHHRYENGELVEADSMKVEIDQKFVTPAGNLVYGGGGITPDVFVPIDTSGKSLGWLYHYFGYGQLDRFAFKYVDERRKELLDYELQKFITDFEITDSLIVDVLTFAGLEIKLEEITAPTLRILKTRMKALIARNIWGNEGLYPILFEHDPMIIRAVKVFNEKPVVTLAE